MPRGMAELISDTSMSHPSNSPHGLGPRPMVIVLLD